MFSRTHSGSTLWWRVQLTCLLLGSCVPVLGDDKDKQASKAPPKVAMCAPLAVPIDATTKVIVRGWGLEGAKEIRSSSPQVAVKIIASGKAPIPNKQDAKQIGDTQVELEVVVAKDTQAGEVELTVVQPDGESQPHKLLLGTHRVVGAQLVVEKEPNDGFTQAQPLVLPQIIDGRIDGDGNVDVFSFELIAQQSITLEVHASRYGSNLDSLLTLFDGRGNIIAVNDDAQFTTDQADKTNKPGTRATQDSKITAVLPAGKYLASLQDAHDRGGPAHPYRLTITAGQ